MCVATLAGFPVSDVKVNTHLFGGLDEEAEVDEAEVVTGVEPVPERREEECQMSPLPRDTVIAYSVGVCV